MTATIESLGFTTAGSDGPDESLATLLLDFLKSQPFLFARVIYGDELTLHFGDEVPPKLPRPGKEPAVPLRSRGTHILRLLTSWWLVAGGGHVVGYLPKTPQPLGKPIAVKDAEQTVPIAVGSTVRSVSPIYSPTPLGLFQVGTRLGLSDGSSIDILPRQRESGEAASEELPDWELQLPGGKRLEVGPGEEFKVTA